MGNPLLGNHRVNLARNHPLRRGFTLIELLVVILIILIVSGLGIGLYHGTGGRQVSEAARLVQGELAGARDRAIRTNRPAGIRVLPDPALTSYLPNGQIDPSQILAANRIIPIESAPNYSDGALSIFRDSSGGSTANYSAAIRTVRTPSGVWSGVPCLVIEQTVVDKTGAPNPPTNWFWNVRVGDQIQINNAGPWYTIVGPMTDVNAEAFVNNGPPGTALPVLLGGLPCEYLLLINGRDDNGNGYIDEGFDGVDEDGVNGTDDGVPNATTGWPGEWESERWLLP